MRFKDHWFRPGAAFGLSILALASSGCTGKATIVAEVPPPEVTVSQPIVREVRDYGDFTGRTVAVKDVEVRARVSGHLVKIGFDDGQEVKEGQLLFEIDPRPYKAILDRAEAEVARAKAAVQKAGADLARSEKLLPTKAISREDYDRDVAARGTTVAAQEAAEAAMRQAALDLEFTSITAPVAGRVSRAYFSVGNLIQAGAGSSAVLTTIVSVDQMYVYFDVDERTFLQAQRSGKEAKPDAAPKHIKDLKVPVDIGLANEDGFPHRGVLDFADNRVDENTGTIRVRAVFDNKDRLLTPGLFVNVRITAGDPHKALLVSERAIGTDQGKKYVLAVDANDAADYRTVTLGGIYDGLRLVESGLQPGDWIVVGGLHLARPGAKVKPEKKEMPVPASRKKAGE
jgi:RND family efflux transporter MFP subunit